MTSFERFQRNARSKISCDGRSSQNGFTGENGSHAKNTISFSENTVCFLYNSKKTSFRQTILMKNYGNDKIYFKIRCNNPKNYVVSPYEEVLDKSEKISLKFEFLPTSRDLNTYKKDKF